MNKNIGFIKCNEPFKISLSCVNPTCGCRISNFLWVSHLYKKIYIETPKCGCSTVKNVLGMRLTPEVILNTYIRKQHSFILNEVESEPYISQVGIGQKLILENKSLDTLNREILKNISLGIKESSPTGKFKFSHYFGTVDEVVSENPGYKVFCVIRDPIKRFLSGINMFYNEEEFPWRRLQRIIHSKALNNSSLDDIVNDVMKYQNHHFNPISSFINNNKINVDFIDIKRLNEYLRDEFKVEEVPHNNQANSYKFNIDNFSKNNLKQIESYYAGDQYIFSKC